jgi:hypothetical protein
VSIGSHLAAATIACSLLLARPGLAQQQPDPTGQSPGADQPEAGTAPPQPAGPSQSPADQGSAASPVPAQPAAPQPPPSDQTASCAPCRECPECPSAKWGSSRILGGHQYIFPTFVESAFVSTYLGARVALASTQITNIPFGRLGTIDLESLRFAEGLDLGFWLFDGVGIFGSFAGIATTSTNSRSLIVRTGAYEVSGQGGAIVKLLRREKTQLSLRGRVSASRGANFTLLPLLNSLTETPAATVEDVITEGLDEFLIVPFSRLNWGGALALAQTINPAFSLQASLGLTVGSTTLELFDPFLDARQDLEISVITPEIAVALTGDARPIGVPLALILEYQFSRPQTTNEQTDRERSLPQNTFAAGLFYSGRPDLQTGVLGFAELGTEPVTGFTAEGEPADSDKPRILGGALTLRYVW